MYDSWNLAIGDPTVLGWLTTAAFIVTAVLCGAYALHVERMNPSCPFRRHRVFWWSLMVALLLLGINKQLDVQTWLTAAGRDLAKTQGWYAQRRTVQMWFVAGVATVSLALMAFTGWAMRHVWQQHRLALLGILLLVSFVVVRAADIHHVNTVLKLGPLRHWFYSILELGGVMCIAISAVVGIINGRKQTKHQTGRTQSSQE